MAISQNSKILASDIKPLYKLGTYSVSYTNIATGYNINFTRAQIGFGDSTFSGYHPAGITYLTTGNAGVVIRGMRAFIDDGVLLRNISGSTLSGTIGMGIVFLKDTLRTTYDATKSFTSISEGGKINATNFAGAWFIKEFSSAGKNISANGALTYTAKDFSLADYSGYTRMGLAGLYTGNSYGYITMVDPKAATGNPGGNVLTIRNGYNGQITCDPKIYILYIATHLK